MVDKKRLTAIKTKIKAITTGKYIPQEGFNPAYVLTKKGQHISRARLLGTIVDKFVSEDRKFSSVTFDDGSDTIRIKAFNSLILDPLNVGDIVDLIGRVKVYNEELYIVPEVLWKTDINYEILRELEIRNESRELDRKRSIVLMYKKQVSDLDELKKLMNEYGISNSEVESIVASEDLVEENIQERVEETQIKERVMEFIEKLDHGEGCDYTELINVSGMKENQLDSAIEQLLEDGLCFEPRPGKIKKL